MAYIDELQDLINAVNGAEDAFNFGQRGIMLDLINKEIEQEEVNDDVFVEFYEDVIKSGLDFDFSAVLDPVEYTAASTCATACFVIFHRFSELEANSSLLGWLSEAIKFTDHLVLHYIQTIRNEAPVRHPDYGIERSRYVQVNNGKYDAQVAGNCMNNLYERRNELEHRTQDDPKNPDRQIIIVPNYNKARKQIWKLYPRVLNSFLTSYKSHYGN